MEKSKKRIKRSRLYTYRCGNYVCKFVWVWSVGFLRIFFRWHWNCDVMKWNMKMKITHSYVQCSYQINSRNKTIDSRNDSLWLSCDNRRYVVSRVNTNGGENSYKAHELGPIFNTFIYSWIFSTHLTVSSIISYNETFNNIVEHFEKTRLCTIRNI